MQQGLEKLPVGQGAGIRQIPGVVGVQASHACEGERGEEHRDRQERDHEPHLCR